VRSVGFRVLVLLLLITGIASACSFSGDDDPATSVSDFTPANQPTATAPAIGAGDLPAFGTPGSTSEASPTSLLRETVAASPDGERVLVACDNRRPPFTYMFRYMFRETF